MTESQRCLFFVVVCMYSSFFSLHCLTVKLWQTVSFSCYYGWLQILYAPHLGHIPCSNHSHLDKGCLISAMLCKVYILLSTDAKLFTVCMHKEYHCNQIFTETTVLVTQVFSHFVLFETLSVGCYHKFMWIPHCLTFLFLIPKKNFP